MAVGTNYVYWTNWGTPALYNGSIMVVPIGGGVPVAIASGLDRPTAIAVNQTGLYWTGSDTLWRLPPGASTPIALNTGARYVNRIAVDSGTVYLAACNANQMWTIPISGASQWTFLANAACPEDIALDSINVYFTTNKAGPNDPGPGSIMVVPKTGGPAVELVAAGGNAGGIAMDAINVYWGAGYQSWSGVAAYPLGGGVRTFLGTGECCTDYLATDGTNVYWTDGPGGVLMAPTLGGTVPAQVATTPGWAIDIKMDSTSFYWTDYMAGLVMKSSK